MRHEVFQPNPPADFVRRAGDTLALIGQAPGREAFSALARGASLPSWPTV
jgi:uncharacterized protein with PhoU and TrkA domain